MINLCIAQFDGSMNEAQLTQARMYFKNDQLIWYKNENQDTCSKQLFARWLLITLLQSRGIDPIVLKNMRKTSSGKLILENLYVSISYSDPMLVVGYSFQDFGIDVENYKKKISAAALKLFQDITGHRIKDEFHFYKRWTEYEASSKVNSGNGLSYHYLKNVDLTHYDYSHYLISDRYLLTVSQPVYSSYHRSFL